MSQKIQAQLSLGSWVFLAGMVGLTGGFTVGAFSAAWALVHGDFIQALVALLSTPICGLLGLCLYAVLGFPVYKYLSSKYPGAREITAIFSPTEGGVNRPGFLRHFPGLVNVASQTLPVTADC